MTDPSDFPKNNPPRKGHEQNLLKPQKGVFVVMLYFGVGLLVLVVMFFIAKSLI